VAYTPQYGGNCAFTTSLGREQGGLAKYWQLRNGKLYLNANIISHLLWKSFPGRLAKADREWKRMTSGK
jgi:hypothetical protein